MYRTGLMLGKFLPLHKGHIALAQFGLAHCDRLIIMLCAHAREPVAGVVRKEWLQATFSHDARVQVELVEYDAAVLPATSVASQEASKLWSDEIRKRFPEVEVFFSSEPYGDYVAAYLNIEHKCFDQERKQVPVAASDILRRPFTHWQFLAEAARPWFVKKICISGSESTGKSTLTERLAAHFNTAFVPEMAREVIGKTTEVRYENLIDIATLHATTIHEKTKQANKILICDTDLHITRSYSKYLFNRPLEVPDWIQQANRYDMHLFLETDCPFVQDGTRLSEEERNRLSDCHKQQLQDAGIHFMTITGNWDERFEKARLLIGMLFI